MIHFNIRNSISGISHEATINSGSISTSTFISKLRKGSISTSTFISKLRIFCCQSSALPSTENGHVHKQLHSSHNIVSIPIVARFLVVSRHCFLGSTIAADAPGTAKVSSSHLHLLFDETPPTDWLVLKGSQ